MQLMKRLHGWKPNNKSPKKPLKDRLRRAAIISGIILVGGITLGGACEYNARDFRNHTREIPCERLNLPEVPGAQELEENLCVSVAGEQPSRIGVERRELPEGRVAVTMFPTWNHDGPLEALPANRNEDAEPVTLILGADGHPEEVRVRSHWVVGMCTWEEAAHTRLVEEDHNLVTDRAVLVAFPNGFHTPVPDCEPRAVEPLDQVENAQSGKEFTFRRVFRWAQAVGTMLRRTFAPLRAFTQNDVPGEDHRCRTQPLF